MDHSNNARVFHPFKSLLFLFLFSLIAPLSHCTEPCNHIDKGTLLQIKTKLGNPRSLSTWLPSTDCCKDWWGGYPYTLTALVCNDQGRVTSLSIEDASDISYEILPDFGDLPFLRTLKLTYGNFSGPIVPSICTKFIKITSLTIANFNVTGSIPDCLGQLQNLKELSLYSNSLSGQIPESLSQLSNLQTLDLSQNNLWGTIPNLSNSSHSMAMLNVAENNLSGPIPKFIGGLHNLRGLYMSSNKFSGSIPSSLGRLAKLVRFSLSKNQLRGRIPKSFGLLPDSISLELDNNRLTGPLPKSMARFSPWFLQLNNNSLTGDVSFLFQYGKSLMQIVNLSNNRFKFNFSKLEIPRNMRSLKISNNRLYGNLPTNVAQVPSLWSIDFRYNQLCGQIPAGWKNFLYIFFEHNKCLCGPPLPLCK